LVLILLSSKFLTFGKIVSFMISGAKPISMAHTRCSPSKEAAVAAPIVTNIPIVTSIRHHVPLALAICACFIIGIAAERVLFGSKQSSRHGSAANVFAGFVMLSDDVRFLGSGWDAPEPWGTWTIASQAGVKIPLKGRPASDVEVSITGRLYPAFEQRQQTIGVSVNGHYLGQMKSGLVDDDRSFKFEVPASVARSQSPMDFVFSIQNPTSPRSIGQSGDTRTLGLGLVTIELDYQAE